MRLSFIVFIVGTLLALCACSLVEDKSPVDKMILGDTTGTSTIDGTVRYLDLEGGFWAIEGDTATYEPTNLPKAFKDDGQRVRVRAKLRKDLGSFRMVGPVIEVRTVERLR